MIALFINTVKYTKDIRKANPGVAGKELVILVLKEIKGNKLFSLYNIEQTKSEGEKRISNLIRKTPGRVNVDTAPKKH